jgi:hypothetical protein
LQISKLTEILVDSNQEKHIKLLLDFNLQPTILQLTFEPFEVLHYTVDFQMNRHMFLILIFSLMVEKYVSHYNGVENLLNDNLLREHITYTQRVPTQ